MFWRVDEDEVYNYNTDLNWISYENEDVTVNNFLNVLMNTETSNGKPVLNTGPNSRVFINILGNGAPGIIKFPTSKQDTLPMQQLINTFNYMWENQLYNEMVIFSSVGESDLYTAYDKWLSDHKILAFSSLKEFGSQWANECPPYDYSLSGKVIGLCMADLF